MRRVIFAAVFFCVLCVAAGLPSPARGTFHKRDVRFGEEVRGGVRLNWRLLEVPTRPGVTQQAVIVQREGPAKGTLLLFPGGNGVGYRLKKKKTTLRLGGNFLVRTAHRIATAGYTAVIVNVPSDQKSGMEDEFRGSPAHRKDIEGLVKFLTGEGHKNIYLVGTSRGTLSTGYLSTVMTDLPIKGFVHTASMNDVMHFPLEKVRRPVLFVHHDADGCQVTEYGAAQANFKRLPNHPRNFFLTVTGGDTPMSPQCMGFSAHGFFGVEKEAVSGILKWIAGETLPKSMGR
ncbi:MAG: hypothetical protein O2807_06145 [bacterium]|nr:hypothetical protein [bacterium]